MAATERKLSGRALSDQAGRKKAETDVVLAEYKSEQFDVDTHVSRLIPSAHGRFYKLHQQCAAVEERIQDELKHLTFKHHGTFLQQQHEMTSVINDLQDLKRSCLKAKELITAVSDVGTSLAGQYGAFTYNVLHGRRANTASTLLTASSQGGRRRLEISGIASRFHTHALEEVEAWCRSLKNNGYSSALRGDAVSEGMSVIAASHAQAGTVSSGDSNARRPSSAPLTQHKYATNRVVGFEDSIILTNAPAKYYSSAATQEIGNELFAGSNSNSNNERKAAKADAASGAASASTALWSTVVHETINDLVCDTNFIEAFNFITSIRQDAVARHFDVSLLLLEEKLARKIVTNGLCRLPPSAGSLLQRPLLRLLVALGRPRLASQYFFASARQWIQSEVAKLSVAGGQEYYCLQATAACCAIAEYCISQHASLTSVTVSDPGAVATLKQFGIGVVAIAGTPGGQQHAPSNNSSSSVSLSLSSSSVLSWVHSLFTWFCAHVLANHLRVFEEPILRTTLSDAPSVMERMSYILFDLCIALGTVSLATGVNKKWSLGLSPQSPGHGKRRAAVSVPGTSSHTATHSSTRSSIHMLLRTIAAVVTHVSDSMNSIGYCNCGALVGTHLVSLVLADTCARFESGALERLAALSNCAIGNIRALKLRHEEELALAARTNGKKQHQQQQQQQQTSASVATVFKLAQALSRWKMVSFNLTAQGSSGSQGQQQKMVTDAVDSGGVLQYATATSKEVTSFNPLSNKDALTLRDHVIGAMQEVIAMTCTGDDKVQKLATTSSVGVVADLYVAQSVYTMKHACGMLSYSSLFVVELCMHLLMPFIDAFARVHNAQPPAPPAAQAPTSNSTSSTKMGNDVGVGDTRRQHFSATSRRNSEELLHMYGGLHMLVHSIDDILVNICRKHLYTLRDVFRNLAPPAAPQSGAGAAVQCIRGVVEEFVVEGNSPTQLLGSGEVPYDEAAEVWEFQPQGFLLTTDQLLVFADLVAACAAVQVLECIVVGLLNSPHLRPQDKTNADSAQLDASTMILTRTSHKITTLRNKLDGFVLGLLEGCAWAVVPTPEEESADEEATPPQTSSPARRCETTSRTPSSLQPRSVPALVPKTKWRTLFHRSSLMDLFANAVVYDDCLVHQPRKPPMSRKQRYQFDLFEEIALLDGDQSDPRLLFGMVAQVCLNITSWVSKFLLSCGSKVAANYILQHALCDVFEAFLCKIEFWETDVMNEPFTSSSSTAEEPQQRGKIATPKKRQLNAQRQVLVAMLSFLRFFRLLYGKEHALSQGNATLLRETPVKEMLMQCTSLPPLWSDAAIKYGCLFFEDYSQLSQQQQQQQQQQYSHRSNAANAPTLLSPQGVPPAPTVQLPRYNHPHNFCCIAFCEDAVMKFAVNHLCLEALLVDAISASSSGEVSLDALERHFASYVLEIVDESDCDQCLFALDVADGDMDERGSVSTPGGASAAARRGIGGIETVSTFSAALFVSTEGGASGASQRPRYCRTLRHAAECVRDLLF